MARDARRRRRARPGRRPRKRIMAWAGLLAGAVALVALGGVLGASFADGTGRAAGATGTPTPAATYSHAAPRAARGPRPAPVDTAQRDEHEAETGDGPVLRRQRHRVRGARQRIRPADRGPGAPDRARRGPVPPDRGPAGDVQLRHRPGPRVLRRADPGGHVPRAGHRGPGQAGHRHVPGPPGGSDPRRARRYRPARARRRPRSPARLHPAGQPGSIRAGQPHAARSQHPYAARSRHSHAARSRQPFAARSPATPTPVIRLEDSGAPESTTGPPGGSTTRGR